MAGLPQDAYRTIDRKKEADDMKKRITAAILAACLALALAACGQAKEPELTLGAFGEDR